MTRRELYARVDELRGILGGRLPKTYAGLLQMVDYTIPHLQVVCRKMDSQRVAGLLLRGEESVILLNTCRSAESLRFTLTHELIHFYLHPQQQKFICAEQKSPLEWEANEGAAELLVPRRSFLPIMENICSQELVRDIYIRETAAQFGVSEQVIRYRIHSLQKYMGQRTVR